MSKFMDWVLNVLSLQDDDCDDCDDYDAGELLDPEECCNKYAVKLQLEIPVEEAEISIQYLQREMEKRLNMLFVQQDCVFSDLEIEKIFDFREHLEDEDEDDEHIAVSKVIAMPISKEG